MDTTARPGTAKEIVATLRTAPYDEVEALVERYFQDPRKQVQSAVASAIRRHAAEAADRERVCAMYETARELGGDSIVIGVDEVGRGSLAGPLAVGAVALPDDPKVWGLNDSKQLSPARRTELAARIRQVAVAWNVAYVEPAAIDALGMAAALRAGMRMAIEGTGVADKASAVLIDGNPVHVHELETCVVKGDALVAPIAAASIVAKVARDELMVGLDEVYPGYHLAASKGYGSAEHCAAIRELGLSPIHRVSFCGNMVDTAKLF